MCRIALLTAIASLPAAALAQPGTKTQIDIRVRLFGTADPFVDHLSLIHPDFSPAEIEVGVFYYREMGVALGTVIHTITGSPFSAALGDSATILDDNPTSTLHPDGRRGNFNFGGQSQAVYHTGAGGVDASRLRIAAINNPDDLTAGGVSIKQNTPVALGTDLDTTDGNFAYHFKLTMACALDGSARTMTLDAPRDRIQSFSAYSSILTGNILPLLPNVLDSDVAAVTLAAPAPAPLALALVAGPATLRRRRR